MPGHLQSYTVYVFLNSDPDLHSFDFFQFFQVKPTETKTASRYIRQFWGCIFYRKTNRCKTQSNANNGAGHNYLLAFF